MKCFINPNFSNSLIGTLDPALYRTKLQESFTEFLEKQKMGYLPTNLYTYTIVLYTHSERENSFYEFEKYALYDRIRDNI